MVYQQSLAQQDEDSQNRQVLDDYLRENPQADRAAILQEVLVKGDLRSGFSVARADAESRGEEWGRVYVGAEERAIEEGYREFLSSVDSESQEKWAAHDNHIGQIQALAPATAYLIKKKLAQGDIAGAFVSINVFTLRAQLARVDPATRAKLQAAIQTEDVAGGFAVLDADRRADFKEFTGQDMPDDPVAAQTIWDAKTLEGHQAALEGYLGTPGVSEALGAKNWDEAYRLAGDERTRLNVENTHRTLEADRAALADYLNVPAVLAALEGDNPDRDEAYRLAGVENTRRNLEAVLAADKAALSDHLEVPGVLAALEGDNPDRDEAYRLANAEIDRLNSLSVGQLRADLEGYAVDNPELARQIDDLIRRGDMDGALKLANRDAQRPRLVKTADASPTFLDLPAQPVATDTPESVTDLASFARQNLPPDEAAKVLEEIRRGDSMLAYRMAVIYQADQQERLTPERVGSSGVLPGGIEQADREAPTALVDVTTSITTTVGVIK